MQHSRKGENILFFVFFFSMGVKHKAQRIHMSGSSQVLPMCMYIHTLKYRGRLCTLLCNYAESFMEIHSRYTYVYCGTEFFCVCVYWILCLRGEFLCRGKKIDVLWGATGCALHGRITDCRGKMRVRGSCP